MNCHVELSREKDAETAVEADTLVMTGRTPFGGFRFCAALGAVQRGGKLRASENRLAIENADNVSLLLAAQSTFRHDDPRLAASAQLEAAMWKSFDALRDAHVTDYQKLFRRVTLSLPRGAAAEKATDARLVAWKAGQADPQLAALLSQFGRYLLISSSRPGTLPANLQGIWNDNYAPPWFSDYTINVNTEMNYWPAEPCNLSELTEPLFTLIDRLHEDGRRAARERYGCRGWVLGTRTRPWALRATWFWQSSPYTPQ